MSEIRKRVFLPFRFTWIVFALTFYVFYFVGFVIVKKAEYGTDAADVSGLLIAFIVVSLVTALLAQLIKKAIVSQKAIGFGLGESAGARILAALLPILLFFAGFWFSRSKERYHRILPLAALGFLIVLILYETIAIYGFVLTFMSKNTMYLHPFIISAFVLAIFAYRVPDKCLKAAKEYVEREGAK